MVGAGVVAAETIRVTATDCGLFDAPTPVMVIVPLYVFGDKPAGLIDTVRRPGADARASHEAPGVADHVNVPPPELETLTVWEPGAAPPTVYENLSAAGVRAITGDARGAIMNVM